MKFVISAYVCVHACALIHDQLFVTLRTVAHQSPLSMGFYLQECWSGLPFPFQGIFPSQGSNPCLLHLLQWQEDFWPLHHLESPIKFYRSASKYIISSPFSCQGLFQTLVTCGLNQNTVRILSSHKISWFYPLYA